MQTNKRVIRELPHLRFMFDTGPLLYHNMGIWRMGVRTYTFAQVRPGKRKHLSDVVVVTALHRSPALAISQRVLRRQPIDQSEFRCFIGGDIGLQAAAPHYLMQPDEQKARSTFCQYMRDVPALDCETDLRLGVPLQVTGYRWKGDVQSLTIARPLKGARICLDWPAPCLAMNLYHVGQWDEENVTSGFRLTVVADCGTEPAPCTEWMVLHSASAEKPEWMSSRSGKCRQVATTVGAIGEEFMTAMREIFPAVKKKEGPEFEAVLV
jgi:hypothetical protein